MKRVRWIALVAAIATAILLYAFLNSLNQPAEIATTGVLVAAQTIPANTSITAQMVKAVELPAEAIVPGSITESAQVVGKVSREEIYTGEQILASNLISPGDSGNQTLAYSVQPGKRAITIAVDVTSGLANLIRPGDHIDLIGDFLVETVDASGQTNKKSYTVQLLQNITVLATDDNLIAEKAEDGSATAYQTITLQVTPQQAMQVSMAQFEGQLRAILRSPLDEEETDLPNVTLDSLLNG